MVSHKKRQEPQLVFQVPPGQKPLTPEQIQEIEKRLAADAAKNGMTVPEFVEKIKAQAAAQKQEQYEANLEQEQELEQIQPCPPTPTALAVADFLRSQDLKVRTCILGGQRKDMFRVKRAFRALQSPSYEKARKKNPLLPEITDRASLENTLKLLPMSFLALRVCKVDPDDDSEKSSRSRKTKRIKGLWTVEIKQPQEFREELYFVWLYEGAQIKQKLYAAGAIAVVFTIVMFPLWPMNLRLGVWYLSIGLLILVGLFFAMAIFRLILFTITMFVVPPGLWLYPNLFEDVGFFDSFRPLWGWQEAKKKGKKKSVKNSGSTNAGATMAAMTGQPAPARATTSSAAPQMNIVKPQQINRATTVKDADEDD